ncbi:MAG: hypothetical protein KME30_31965 [Iphinoe sp. HA4291-MV1]|jgi:hypothetical protein|nr:hypothetical protein [Iphinoe sp. HA4291-MV1]
MCINVKLAAWVASSGRLYEIASFQAFGDEVYINSDCDSGQCAERDRSNISEKSRFNA